MLQTDRHGAEIHTKEVTPRGEVSPVPLPTAPRPPTTTHIVHNPKGTSPPSTPLVSRHHLMMREPSQTAANSHVGAHRRQTPTSAHLADLVSPPLPVAAVPKATSRSSGSHTQPEKSSTRSPTTTVKLPTFTSTAIISVDSQASNHGGAPRALVNGNGPAFIAPKATKSPPTSPLLLTSSTYVARHYASSSSSSSRSRTTLPRTASFSRPLSAASGAAAAHVQQRRRTSAKTAGPGRGGRRFSHSAVVRKRKPPLHSETEVR